MEISGVGTTPQPESDKDPRKILIDEKRAESIFNKLNKNGDSVIDENDGIDRSMLAALKNLVKGGLTLDNLKKVAGELGSFTYTKADKYNGKDAQITYDLYGHIRSVNTGAQNLEEARMHMGLDKEHVAGYSTGDRVTYGREYEKNNGVRSEYFTWNPETKSMDFDGGGWVSYDFINRTK